MKNIIKIFTLFALCFLLSCDSSDENISVDGGDEGNSSLPIKIEIDDATVLFFDIDDDEDPQKLLLMKRTKNNTTQNVKAIYSDGSSKSITYAIPSIDSSTDFNRKLSSGRLGDEWITLTGYFDQSSATKYCSVIVNIKNGKVLPLPKEIKVEYNNSDYLRGRHLGMNGIDYYRSLNSLYKLIIGDNNVAVTKMLGYNEDGINFSITTENAIVYQTNEYNGWRNCKVRFQSGAIALLPTDSYHSISDVKHLDTSYFVDKDSRLYSLVRTQNYNSKIISLHIYSFDLSNDQIKATKVLEHQGELSSLAYPIINQHDNNSIVFTSDESGISPNDKKNLYIFNPVEETLVTKKRSVGHGNNFLKLKTKTKNYIVSLFKIPNGGGNDKNYISVLDLRDYTERKLMDDDFDVDWKSLGHYSSTSTMAENCDKIAFRTGVEDSDYMVEIDLNTLEITQIGEKRKSFQSSARYWSLRLD